MQGLEPYHSFLLSGHVCLHLRYQIINRETVLLYVREVSRAIDVPENREQIAERGKCISTYFCFFCDSNHVRVRSPTAVDILKIQG